MAADGRRFVDQVNLETGGGQIKRGLNTADPSADNHHIAKITVCETFANTVCVIFYPVSVLSTICDFVSVR